VTEKKNPTASIRGRLKARALRDGYNPARFLTAYYHEGIIARIVASAYHENFVLKGGLSLFGRYGFLARPTTDIDLGVRGVPNDPERVRGVFAEIVAVDFEDHLRFDAASIQSRAILENATYPGVRLEIPVHLGESRDRLQLDLSFGNIITPAPVVIDFPAVLEPRSYPILGYPLETLVAEKFAAACELGLDNTRQKDFFDLYAIARSEALDADSLSGAIRATFEARGTPLERRAVIFAPAFSAHSEMQRLWALFLKRQPLDAPVAFSEVVAAIRAMLEPLLDGRAQGRWQPEANRWSNRAAPSEPS
jgi:predicted nucleotidyltransferase component of viral defense system